MATTPCEVFYRPTEEPEPERQPPRALTVRLPYPTFRYLEVMAEHADLSLNAMAVQLIEWGVSFGLDNLPQEMRDPIGEAVEGPDYYRNKGN